MSDTTRLIAAACVVVTVAPLAVTVAAIRAFRTAWLPGPAPDDPNHYLIIDRKAMP